MQKYEFCFGKKHLSNEYFDNTYYNVLKFDKIDDLIAEFTDMVGEGNLLRVNMYYCCWGIVVTQTGAVNLKFFYPDLAYAAYVQDWTYPYVDVLEEC